MVGDAARLVPDADVDALGGRDRGGRRAPRPSRPTCAARLTGAAAQFTWERTADGLARVWRVVARRAMRRPAVGASDAAVGSSACAPSSPAASGFVGRHLVGHLHEQGDEVTSLDRHGSHAVDITDGPAVAAAIADAAPDAVYHLAGWADVGASWDDPVGVFRVNAEGTLHVLRACIAAGSQRVLAVASADVYGVVTRGRAAARRGPPLRPTSPYAASKVAAEALALQAFLGHGLGVVRVRPFNHLGPGQSERFVAPALAGADRPGRAGRRDASIPVGNLSARRDFTDVRDVVRAYRLLVEHGAAGRGLQRLQRATTSPIQDAGRPAGATWRSAPDRPRARPRAAATGRPPGAARRRLEAAGGHRLGAAVPTSTDARRPARRHATTGGRGPSRNRS